MNGTPIIGPDPLTTLTLANVNLAGNQAFSFIGSAIFSHTAGELRAYQAAGQTWIQGDIDGDGVADFLIRIDGLHTLTASDFIL